MDLLRQMHGSHSVLSLLCNQSALRCALPLRALSQLAGMPAATATTPRATSYDILERLPAMTNRDDLTILLPSNWQPSTPSPALEDRSALNL
jgi:hypothetical protein